MDLMHTEPVGARPEPTTVRTFLRAIGLALDAGRFDRRADT